MCCALCYPDFVIYAFVAFFNASLETVNYYLVRVMLEVNAFCILFRIRALLGVKYKKIKYLVYCCSFRFAVVIESFCNFCYFRSHRSGWLTAIQLHQHHLYDLIRHDSRQIMVRHGCHRVCPAENERIHPRFLPGECRPAVHLLFHHIYKGDFLECPKQL